MGKGRVAMRCAKLRFHWIIYLVNGICCFSLRIDKFVFDLYIIEGNIPKCNQYSIQEFSHRTWNYFMGTLRKNYKGPFTPSVCVMLREAHRWVSMAQLKTRETKCIANAMWIIQAFTRIKLQNWQDSFVIVRRFKMANVKGPFAPSVKRHPSPFWRLMLDGQFGLKPNQLSGWWLMLDSWYLTLGMNGVKDTNINQTCVIDAWRVMPDGWCERALSLQLGGAESSQNVLPIAFNTCVDFDCTIVEW